MLLLHESENMKTKIVFAFVTIVGTFGLIGCKPKTTTLKSDQTNQPILEPAQIPVEQTNLKPVVGAFGWKLGDKLPEQLSSKVQDANYNFTPDTDMPPFVKSNNCSFYLSLTKDGQIAQISAMALNVRENDLYDSKRGLISLLTDKYGLRVHDPNESEGDSYHFGTVGRQAHLSISGSGIFKLDFYDLQLYMIVCDEYNARIKKEDAAKTAPLSNQLQ